MYNTKLLNTKHVDNNAYITIGEWWSHYHTPLTHSFTLSPCTCSLVYSLTHLQAIPTTTPRPTCFARMTPRLRRPATSPSPQRCHSLTSPLTTSHTRTHAHILPLYHIITASCHVITQSPTIAYLCSHSLTTWMSSMPHNSYAPWTLRMETSQR